MPIFDQPDLILEKFRTESNPVLNIVNATNKRILLNERNKGRGLLEELLLGRGNGQESVFGTTNGMDSIFNRFNNDILADSLVPQQISSSLLEAI